MKNLKEPLRKYINDTLNPITNMELALEYEKIGQGAAALSFFLRTAELVYETDPLLAYTCILKTWKQMNNTTRRPVWEIEQLFTAVTFNLKELKHTISLVEKRVIKIIIKSHTCIVV